MRPLPMRLLPVLALALAGPAAAESAEPIVAMSSPAAVALAFRERGYRARLSRDDSDRPLITSGTGGVVFNVVFYGCTGGGGCTGVLFTSGFDLPSGIGLAAVNEWNADSLVGRAFVDGRCDPTLDHYLTADPLMSGAAFETLLQDWDLALSEFADFIGLGDDTPRAGAVACGPGTDAI